HRLTARNTLVLTTKRISCVYGGRTPNVPDQAAYRDLIVALHDRFPTLKGLAIQSCWSGYISHANDSLPVVGETGVENNILYTAGCSGHGVGSQSLMGQLLAERIRGNEHPLLAALRHKTPPMLPGPLQWLAVKCGLGLMNMLDNQVNRKLRHSDAR